MRLTRHRIATTAMLLAFGAAMPAHAQDARDPTPEHAHEQAQDDRHATPPAPPADADATPAAPVARESTHDDAGDRPTNTPPPRSAPAPAPAKAAPAAAPAATAAPDKPAAVSLTKDSLAGDLIDEVSGATAIVASRVAGFATLFSDLRFATRFTHTEITAPGGPQALWDRLAHGLGLLAVAIALMIAPRPLLRRAMVRLEASVVRADERAARRRLAEGPAAPPPAPGPGSDAPAVDAPVTDAPAGGDRDDTPITDRVTPPDAVTSVAEGEASEAERASLDAEGKPQAAPAKLSHDAIHAGAATRSPLPPGDPVAAPSEEERQEQIAGAARAAETEARRRDERARDAMNRHRTLHVLRRVPVALLRLLVELLPVLAFAVVFWIGLAALDMNPATTRIYSAVGVITIGAWSLLALLRSILSPKQPALRLLGADDGFPRRLYAWLRLVVIVAAVAAAMIQWAEAITMPTRGVRALARLIVLIEHLLLAGMIWDLRKPIAERLTPPRRVRDKPFGRMLALAANWWWVPALFFDLALWLVWAAQIRDGYERIWRLFLSTVVIIVAARFAAIALLGLLDRLLRLDEARAGSHPLLEARVQRYYPILRRLLTWALVAVGAILLMQAWGLPALGWLGSTIGRRVTSALGSIVVAVVFAVTAYEFVSILLQRQVDRYVDSGQSVRAGRLRTLLPIIRSVLLVVLGIIVIFTVLSQIGVNVAPLLAGASIIGVALGFGSQKLVQDFITGIFLLLENAMQVGDTVTAGGLTGVVEHLSVRTLRLRAGDGSVHIIPFSSVSTVTNANRGRGNAAVSFDIAPSADVDRASDILKAIALEMRTEDAFRDGMLSDLQYWGVNAVSGTAVNLAGQIVCTDSARWAVQREFNRRVLIAFRDKGIELANTMQTVQLVGDTPRLVGETPRAHDGSHA